MNKISDNVIRQVFLILLITFTGIIIVYNLQYFIPGVLGAITLYILFRNTFFNLTEKKGWKKVWTSLFLILITLIGIVLPLWLLAEILIPQVNSILDNRQIIIEKYNAVKAFMQTKPFLKKIDISDAELMGYLQKIAGYIPAVLNSVAEVVVNILTALFLLYFFLVQGRNMERRIKMPLSDANRQIVWDETNMMVRANALGIPIMGLCQGIIAAIGYYIFGVNNALLWGMITGAATIVPAVGTMVVWVPIAIVHLAQGHTSATIGLVLYCLIAVGGIDNVLRFTLLKKIGDVHPLITVFGVILGLKLFGIIGLIFGPLLLSYFNLLLKIYRTEFSKEEITNTEPTQPSDPNPPELENNYTDNAESISHSE
ncbi:MAG TPA: AI-2E family transporter [Niabella sp.]|nr:AI-2E family transporter [Niabella sp.]